MFESLEKAAKNVSEKVGSVQDGISEKVLNENSLSGFARAGKSVLNKIENGIPELSDKLPSAGWNIKERNQKESLPLRGIDSSDNPRTFKSPPLRGVDADRSPQKRSDNGDSNEELSQKRAKDSERKLDIPDIWTGNPEKPLSRTPKVDKEKRSNWETLKDLTEKLKR